MISKELTTWFQEEVKKEIADVMDHRDAPTMAVSLSDEKGIVWMEGFKHMKVEPLKDESEYLIHYSIQREETFQDDLPFSMSITVIDDEE
jgi:hypothetical protein